MNLASTVPLHTSVETFPLGEANQALTLCDDGFRMLLSA
jgi:hypothetical protein